MAIKVELQVSLMVNGRPIWMRSKTVPKALTVPLGGADYDTVVEEAEKALADRIQDADEKSTAKTSKKK